MKRETVKKEVKVDLQGPNPALFIETLVKMKRETVKKKMNEKIHPFRGGGVGTKKMFFTRPNPT